MAPTLLCLSHFSISPARHGGQIRVHHLLDCAAQAGFQVVHGAAVPAHQKSGTESLFLTLDGILSHQHLKDPLWRDYFLAADLPASARARKWLGKIIRDKRPAIIQIDHPWLWPLAKAVLAEQPGGRLVYSSHNIEWRLKEEILAALGITNQAGAVEETRRLEYELAAAADRVFAVTREDQAELAAHAARPVLLAPNGTRPKHRGYFAGAFPAALPRPPERYVLYVGSAHLPNLTGFRKLVTSGLAQAPANGKIIMAGEVVHLFNQAIAAGQVPAEVASRVIKLPKVTNPELESLIDNSAGVIIPLVAGGGSNLKTAEAIYSGRPVVATTKALRGFESFAGQPGLFIHDTPEGFTRAIVGLLSAPPLEALYYPAQDQVLWSNSLKPIHDFYHSCKGDL